MKLTFTKVSTGKKVSKEIAIPTPSSRAVNKAKDLFYFIDLNEKDSTGYYKIKCCKLSKIDKNRTDFEVLRFLNEQK